jgi:ATP-dependent RNA helicase DDX24/MAK5
MLRCLHVSLRPNTLHTMRISIAKHIDTHNNLFSQMSTGDHDHLLNLKKLRFLVVDEADRMISQGSFPQLKGIFEKMQQANPSLEYMEKHAEDVNDSDSEDEDRMLSLPGIPGEAKVTMLDDNLLKMIERQRTGQDDDSLNSGNDADAPEPIEIDDEEYEKEQARFQEEIERIDQIDDAEVEEEEQAVKRQTFIFSATLTLPSSSDQSIASKPKGKKGKGKQKKGKLSVDGAIAEILETIGAQGQTKIVDLSTSSNKLQNTRISKTKQDPTQKPTVELPPGLSLYEILCTQRHKDSHLYSFLTTTKQGSSGPCLVFCNSIGAVKRVGETLKILGLPVRMLHAQMQQKARLSSLESLSKLNLRAVVVATDVAARGLDIPSVASIVHYDVARATDTFVHRAGRTARGVGEKAIGWSVSLVSAPEERSHKSICRAILGDVKSTFDVAPMDSRLLANASERVNLASKIVACEDAESKTNKSNQWFRKASEEAGLDLDEDLLDDGQLGGSKKERQQFLEAKRARQELKALLAKPMRKQAFGKFLSNAGLRDAIQAENEVKPYVVTEGRQNRKKKRKVDSKVSPVKF